MSKELYKKYRPKTLDEVVGQAQPIAQLKSLVEKNQVPHAMLITGPSGTGKTTLARILRRVLECNMADYVEVDCACVDSPLETVRNMRRAMQLRPMAGKCRIWFLEEAQSLSRAGFSQQALLKLLEDVPEHVYFFLATTDASKLHRAVKTRTTEIRLAALAPAVLHKLLLSVVEKENLKVSKDLLTEIVEASEGSARKALVILEQVGFLPAAEQESAVTRAAESKDEAIALARELINPRCSWPAVAKILKELGEQDCESLRYLVLGYSRSVMLGGGNLAPRAFRIIDVFSSNFYDSKHAGLAAACWEVVHAD